MNHDWAGLPKHLLGLIVEKLESSIDYLRFGAVCLTWHSMIKENKSKHINVCRSHHVPLLLVPNEDKSWSMYDVMHEKFSETSKFFIPYDKRFCGSSEGWLLGVNDDWTVSLCQPFPVMEDQLSNIVGINIRLPCIFPPEIDDEFDELDDYIPESLREVHHDYHVWRAIITADPFSNSDECTVMAIFGSACQLAFIRPVRDSTWTKIDLNEFVEDILYCNNQFYIVNGYGALISFSSSVTDGNNNISSVKVAREIPRKFRNETKRYLVKSCGGEILLVERLLDYDPKLLELDLAEIRLDLDQYDGFRFTKKFRIFRLDLDMGIWIEIKSLGDTTLFLGDNSSVSVLASNFVGCQPNCIYFTHDIDSVYNSTSPVICDLGIYEVESRSFKLHYTIGSAHLRKMARRPPIWVLPPLNAF